MTNMQNVNRTKECLGWKNIIYHSHMGMGRKMVWFNPVSAPRMCKM